MGLRPEQTSSRHVHDVEGIVHFLSEEAGRHLLALCEDFDLVWCTGWEEKANDHLARALGVGRHSPT